MIQKQTAKEFNMAPITVTATTHNPERAEFITVTGPRGTEHTYFYDASTVTAVLEQLGLNPARPLCQMVEEALRAAMDGQRAADSATLKVVFELGEDLDARWELVQQAA